MLPRLFCAIAAFLIATVLASASASAEPYDAGHARVELISERAAAVPGETVYLALHKELDEDWHVYWRNAGDAGLPPQILWDESPLGEVTEDADFTWPLPHEIAVVEGEIMDYGYDDAVTLPFAYTVPENAAGEIRFEGTADYLICKDVCIPETAPVAFTLKIEDAQVPDRRGARLIAEAIEAAPTAFAGAARYQLEGDALSLSLQPETPALLQGGTLRFFPYGDPIIHSAPQRLETGENGATLRMTADSYAPQEGALEGVIAVTRADGTRTGFAVSASEGQLLAGTYGTLAAAPAVAGEGSLSWGGIAAIAGLALLGGLILNLMPCVLPVLSIKAVGMVQAASHGEKAHLRAHGLWYTAGVLLTFLLIAGVFVALRAAGEFVSLGFQLQYPPVVAALALLVFAIGLWLTGFFELGTSVQGAGSGLAARQGSAGAFFTGVLAAVVGAPCVGPFLGVALGAVITQPALVVFLVFALMGLGLALPFLALSIAPGLQRILPRPGAWMERLKQFFAFPMFLTAVWLLDVLAQQAGSGAVSWTVAGAVALTFGIWLMRSVAGRGALVGRVAGAAAIGFGLYLALATAMRPVGAPVSQTAYSEAEFETVAWSPEAVEEALAEGKGVFVDFTAAWCVICQANKRTTLSRADVRGAMEAADIVFMVADFTNRDDVIAEELRRRGRAGVPMYLLYGPGEDEPKLLPQTLSPGLMLREIAAVSGS